MKRFFLLLVLLFVFLAFSVTFYFRNTTAQDTELKVSAEARIIDKLNKISENQNQILQKLEDLRQEVKARCR
ncbi:MAG: hypothetical protein ABH954_01985 [Candidatus Omnitrophota bacterium]